MLHFFLKNPFASPRISISNFDKLVKAHLAALEVANTNGSLTEALHETQSLYNEFNKHLTSKAISTSVQKGQTENLDTWLDSVINFIAEQEPNVQYQFRKEPGKYAEFYPNGVTEYRRAGKDEILTLFKRFVDACTPHADKLGKDVVKEAQQLYEALQLARNGQLQKKQNVKSLSGTADDCQYRLAVRLYQTLGMLMNMYAEQPEAIQKFFDFSFLSKPALKKLEEASAA